MNITPFDISRFQCNIFRVWICCFASEIRHWWFWTASIEYHKIGIFHCFKPYERITHYTLEILCGWPPFSDQVSSAASIFVFGGSFGTGEEWDDVDQGCWSAEKFILKSKLYVYQESPIHSLVPNTMKNRPAIVSQMAKLMNSNRHSASVSWNQHTQWKEQVSVQV